MNPNRLNMNVSPKQPLPIPYVNRPDQLRDSNLFPQNIKNLVIDLEKIWFDIMRVPYKGGLLEDQIKQRILENLNGMQNQYNNVLRGWKYDLDQERNIREEQTKKFEQQLKSKQNDLVATQNRYQQEIAQLNSIIKQKENEINTRILVIQTKDNQINSCNERVQQKDNEINNHNAIIQQKDNEINKNNNLIRQKDNEIIKNTALIRQKDSEIININSILRQKDDQIKFNSNLLKQKEDEIKQHKTMIQQKDNELNTVNTLIRQKVDEIQRLKLELSNALRDIDQSKQKLVEADTKSISTITDYEKKIAELRSENQLLSQDLDRVNKDFQSQNIESLKQNIKMPGTEIIKHELYHEADNQQIKIQKSNVIQQLSNSSYISQSSIVNQKSMNCIRFMQHQCELHGKPIEYFCIDQICNHISRRMCGRCGRKGGANVVHIENIIECLVNFRLKEEQIQNINKAQLWQQFQNINYQIIEQLNHISQNIDFMFQQFKGDHVVEYLIKELISEDNISSDQIESLAGQIATVITLDSEDEYNIKTIYNIEEEQAYINIIELLSQHDKILKQFQNISFILQEPQENQVIHS